MFSKTLAALLSAGLLFSATPSHARIIDKIVAVVDGEIITLSQVQQRVLPLAAQLAAEVTDPTELSQKQEALGREILQQMIDEKLLENAAEELELGVTAEEVDRGIDQVLKNNKLSLADLELALKDQGSTLKQFRQNIKGQLLRLKVVSAKVQPKVNVTEEEARTACETETKQQPTGTQTEVDLSQIIILLPETLTDAELLEKKKKAETAVARLQKGEDFAKVAAELSEDSLIDLGSFTLDMLDPDLAENISKLEAGQVSSPMRESGLFRILKVNKKRTVAVAASTTCDDQLATYRLQLEEQETEKYLKQYLGELRKKAYIEVKL